MPAPARPVWWLSGEMLGAIGLVAALAAAAWFGMDHVFDWLDRLDRLVQRHYWIALLVFAISFIGLILTTLPVGTVFCLAGGYFFGLSVGAATALLAGTVGALLTFLLIRRAAAQRFRSRYDQGQLGHWVRVLERDATWYLILLRIIPIAPFFIVNAAASLTNIRSAHFTMATGVGLIPTTVLYAAVGRGLDGIEDARDQAGPALLLEPAIGLPLLGLGLILLVSWWWHHRLRHSRPQAR